MYVSGVEKYLGKQTFKDQETERKVYEKKKSALPLLGTSLPNTRYCTLYCTCLYNLDKSI
jgi:hypothetical protein